MEEGYVRLVSALRTKQVNIIFDFLKHQTGQ